MAKADKKDKCPHCGCKETKTTNLRFDDPCNPFIEETWTKCANCNRLKHHWAYGWTYFSNWKDLTVPPARCKIKTFIKRLFSRKPKKQKIENDNLPF